MKSKKFLWLVVALILFCWVYEGQKFRPASIIRDIFSIVAYPVLKITHTITTYFKKTQEQRLSHQELKTLVTRLRTQNKELLSHVISLKSTLYFHELTSPLIEFQERYNRPLERCAQVIMRTLNNQEQTILVDRGSRHGIKKDMVAVWYNYLVGRVQEVFPLFSTIVLITDKRCTIAALCPDSKAYGIMQGLNDPQLLSLGYVDHLASMKVGFDIVSSGQGIIFPQGFGLGTVIECQKGPLYYSLIVKLPYKVDQIEYCHLMLKSELPED